MSLPSREDLAALHPGAQVKTIDLTQNRIAILLIEDPTLEDLQDLETYMALWVQARARSIESGEMTA